MRISDWSSDVCSSDLLDRHIIVFGIFRKPHHDVAVGLIIARFDRLDRVLDDIGERLSDLAPVAHQHHRIALMLEREMNVRMRDRSEEHTSELQSLMRISYAVFCLQKKT